MTNLELRLLAKHLRDQANSIGMPRMAPQGHVVIDVNFTGGEMPFDAHLYQTWVNSNKEPTLIAVNDLSTFGYEPGPFFSRSTFSADGSVFAVNGRDSKDSRNNQPYVFLLGKTSQGSITILRHLTLDAILTDIKALYGDDNELSYQGFGINMALSPDGSKLAVTKQMVLKRTGRVSGVVFLFDLDWVNEEINLLKVITNDVEVGAVSNNTTYFGNALFFTTGNSHLFIGKMMGVNDVHPSKVFYTDITLSHETTAHCLGEVFI